MSLRVRGVGLPGRSALVRGAPFCAFACGFGLNVAIPLLLLLLVVVVVVVVVVVGPGVA